MGQRPSTEKTTVFHAPPTGVPIHLLLRAALFEAAVERRLLRGIASHGSVRPACEHLDVAVRQRHKHIVAVVERDAELALQPRRTKPSTQNPKQ